MEKFVQYFAYIYRKGIEFYHRGKFQILSFWKKMIDIKMPNNDKKDISKSIKLLNDLSKYDNAQSLFA